MKVNFLRIPLIVVAMALTLPGCLKDETRTKEVSGSSNGRYEEPVPTEQEVEKELFSKLNLDYPGLEAVKAAVAAQEWGKAAVELQKYMRHRTNVVNPNVNLVNPTASETEQGYANYALKDNDYRFHVKGFQESDGRPYSYKADDGSIDWMRYIDGPQEQHGQVHRHQWFVPQAKTYKMTRDEQYLSNWIEVYDSWWINNPAPASYPEGTTDKKLAGWVPLSIAARVMDQCDLFEYYKWGEAFNAGELTRFLNRFAFQVEFIKANYWSDSNHRISQAQAVTFAGLLFPEFANASEWFTNGSGVLNEEIVKQYYADGWLKDNDLHYHIGAIESFRLAMVLAKANGQQSRFGTDYVEAIRRMVDVEKYLIYPNYATYNGGTDYNYSTPNFGDTRSRSWTRNVLLRHMRNFRDLFPDDMGLKWLASQGIEGEAPAKGIKCFNDAGHYTIRNGWTKESTMMILINTAVTPSEKWHRQWDNNNFELFLNGRQFFPDSGVFSYGGTSEENAARRKYAATSAHSTLTLGDTNITGCRGVCLLAQEGAQNDILVLENPSYSNLTHRRSVFFVDHKFFVLVDEAYGAAAGVVNLHYHLLPGSDSEVVVDDANHGAYTAFADRNNIAVRSFSAEALSTTARTGFLSVDSNLSVDRKSYKVGQTKTADKAARYITVIYPSQDAASTQISASFLDQGFSAAGPSVRVSVDGRIYNLSYTL